MMFIAIAWSPFIALLVTLPDIHVRNFLEAPYRSAAVDDRDLQRNIAKGETV